MVRRGESFPPPPPPADAPQRAALLSTPLFHVTATAVLVSLLNSEVDMYSPAAVERYISRVQSRLYAQVGS